MAGQISLIIHWSILPRCQSGKKVFSKDSRIQDFCTFIPPTKQRWKTFMKAHIWHKLTAFSFVQRIPHAASPSEHWDIQGKKYMMHFKRSQKKFVYKSVRNQLYILLRKLFPSDAASWTCGQKVGRKECTNQCIVTSRERKQSKYSSKRGHLAKHCKYLDILVQRNSTNGFTSISKMENCIKTSQTWTHIL